MAKWYTRIIGVFFLLVAFSLAADVARFGFRPETMHQIFHVLLGFIVVRWGWNDERWWRPFSGINGLFFLYVSLFGLLFSGFGGLDAFNKLDTILHGTVGVSGVVVWLLTRAVPAPISGQPSNL